MGAVDGHFFKKISYFVRKPLLHIYSYTCNIFCWIELAIRLYNNDLQILPPVMVITYMSKVKKFKDLSCCWLCLWALVAIFFFFFSELQLYLAEEHILTSLIDLLHTYFKTLAFTCKINKSQTIILQVTVFNFGWHWGNYKLNQKLWELIFVLFIYYF